MNPLRLAFMGTPEFALPALKALVKSGHQVVAVYCQPPRPSGRGQQLQKSPVHLYAESQNIPVYTPISLRKPEPQAEFAALQLDIAVVAAYGLILPKLILEAPRLGCVNIHASLLPRWRGAAPIHRALLAGDPQTGITIMQMDEGLDTGPMLMSKAVPIIEQTTSSELHDTLAALGAELIIPALEGLAAGTLKPVTQPTEGVTYAKKLEKEEGLLTWTEEAISIVRKVRAFTPWPGTWFEYGGEQIKVLAAEVISSKTSASPGTLLSSDLTIACSSGAIRLIRVQRPGRKPLSGEEFLRGFTIPLGTRLGQA